MTDDPTTQAGAKRASADCTTPSTSTPTSAPAHDKSGCGTKSTSDVGARPATSNPAPGDPVHTTQGEKRTDAPKSGGTTGWSPASSSVPSDDDSGEGHKGPRTDLRPSTTDARAEKDHDQPAPPTHEGSKPGELTPKAPRPNPQSAPGAQDKPVVKSPEPQPAQTHGGAGSM